jgi:membrane protein DedA with SNARE-associated domain
MAHTLRCGEDEDTASGVTGRRDVGETPAGEHSMPDSAVVAPDDVEISPGAPRPGRRTLTLLVVPIVVLVIASNVGDALATTLATTHPLALIALNSRSRNLVLVTNELDAFSFYTVATARLLLSDPLFFLLGYWYGDAAVRWIEKRTRTFGSTLRQIEGWFGRAAYPLVFIAPNNYICLFAGAAGMNVAGFFVTNLAGTLVRLYLIRRVGETFEAPLDDVLGFLAEYRIPLLIVSVILVGVFSLIELRRGESEIDALLHIEDEVLPEADDTDAPSPEE